MDNQHTLSPFRKEGLMNFNSKFSVACAVMSRNVLVFFFEWDNNWFVWQLRVDANALQDFHSKEFPFTDARLLTSVAVSGSELLNVALFVAVKQI